MASKPADLKRDSEFDHRPDELAELRAESMTELSDLLERVRLIKGIGNTETSILLATFR